MTDEQLMARSLYDRCYCRLPTIISELGKHHIARDLAIWDCDTVLNVIREIDDTEDLIEWWLRVEQEVKNIK